MGAPNAAAEPGRRRRSKNSSATPTPPFPTWTRARRRRGSIWHRDEPEWKRIYDFAFGKRPGEELYDLRKDPSEIHNVAADPAYAAEKEKLAAR